jgi:hypothetical protein
VKLSEQLSETAAIDGPRLESRTEQQDVAPGPSPPEVLLGSGMHLQAHFKTFSWTRLLRQDALIVQDESLKKLMMAWYYAGYYTGMFEGQQQAQKRP